MGNWLRDHGDINCEEIDKIFRCRIMTRKDQEKSKEPRKSKKVSLQNHWISSPSVSVYSNLITATNLTLYVDAHPKDEGPNWENRCTLPLAGHFFITLGAHLPVHLKVETAVEEDCD